MGEIKAICISEKRGTQKKYIDSAYLKENWGIEGDAHAGDWHRQVSLLSYNKIEDFKKLGVQVDHGAFGENIVAEGLDFAKMPVGTRLKAGEALLEITQIGKECHTHCAIYHAVGDCIMPREGVFAKVLKGGEIKVGDNLEVIERTEAKPFAAAVITLSDKGSKGERDDKSGSLIAERLKAAGYDVIERFIIADDKNLLAQNLMRLTDQRQPDLIITTGSTGFAPRDIAPETTKAVADKDAPGIAEAIRTYSMKITPRAMLSRGVSVIRKNTLIINLPGSPKACSEALDCILETLPHGLELLRGEGGECARV